MLHFLFLKIISFLYFQICKITVNHTTLQMCLTLLPTPAKMKPTKCSLAWEWCTSYTPNHHLHSFHIWLITEHVKNTWLIVSTLKLHRTYTELPTEIRNSGNLSLVGNLLRKTLQAHLCDIDTVLTCHRLWYILSPSPPYSRMIFQ